MSLTWFSEEQRAVITTPKDQDQLVIAAAGSGKTSCIGGRILFLNSEHGVPFNSMACVTYSKRLAHESAQKLKKVGIEGLNHNDTIDSLCWRLLSRSTSTDFQCEPAQIILKFLTKVEQDDQFGRLVDRGVSHVFIDEAQDLDADRLRAIRHMCAGCCVLVVGDPRQTIYMTLFAANPTHMFQLRPDALQRQLTETFRCGPGIVDFVNSALEFKGLPPMRSHGGSHDRPTIVRLHANERDAGVTRPEVVHLIVKRVRDLLTGGALPGDVMCLSPTMRGATLQLVNCVRDELAISGIKVFINKREIESADRAGRAPPRSVYFGTVHSAKGDERKHVILLNFYVASGAFRKNSPGGGPNPDYLTLLYTACTRASVSLTMLETCHLPSVCEAVHFVQQAIGSGSLAEQNIREKRLGKSLKQTEEPVTGITQVIAALDAQESQALEAALLCGGDANDVVLSANSRNARHSTPAAIVDNNDSDLYGLFIEAVITRRVAERTGNAALLEPFSVLPVCLSDTDYRKLLDGKHRRLAPQFASSGRTVEQIVTLVEDVRRGRKQSEVYQATKDALKREDVYVLASHALYRQTLERLLPTLTRIGDLSVTTGEVIQDMWNHTLLASFPKNFVGLYWVGGQQLSDAALLPVGATSWAAYLDAAVDVILAEVGTVVAYQHHVTSNGRLHGIIDIVGTDGQVIDIKTSMGERQVAGMANRAQVRAYRALLNDAEKNSATAFLFSALSLNMYRIPSAPAGDSAVVDVLEAASARRCAPRS